MGSRLSRGGDAHDAVVGRVETERGRRKRVRDEVNPKELHRNESLGHAQKYCQEDADDFTDVRGDYRKVSYRVRQVYLETY